MRREGGGVCIEVCRNSEASAKTPKRFVIVGRKDKTGEMREKDGRKGR